MASRNGRPPKNLGLLFEWHAENSNRTSLYLDRPFDIAPDRGTHFGVQDLASLVAETSGWLSAAGLRRGQRLAIIKDNHYDVVVLAAAAARLGAVPAMISPAAPDSVLRVILTRLDPALAVVTPSVLDRALADRRVLLPPDLPVVLLGKTSHSEARTVQQVDDIRGADAPPPAPRGDDEPMIVIHTSGTTGVPKLVVHSGDTILGAMSRLESIRWPIVESRRDDVVGTCVSFVHGRSVTWTYGQLNLAPKGLVAFAEPGLDTVAATLARHRPTTLEACPNIFQYWEELADTQPHLFEQVRLFVGTFDAIHPRTVRKFLSVSKRRMPIWGQGWGQSELGPVCAAMYSRRQMRRAGGLTSVTSDIGWPVPILNRVRVLDPQTGRPVAKGEQGLLFVKSKACCVDYLGETDRWTEKRDGKWWNTGDIGARAKFGKLRLIDREVDMIPGMSGIELESILLDRLPTARDVVVLGVPGGRPLPVLVMRDDHIDEQEWQRVSADLPGLDKPRVIPWGELPRTGTWKVRRPDLREQLLGSGETFGTGRWT